MKKSIGNRNTVEKSKEIKSSFRKITPESILKGLDWNIHYELE